MRSPQWTLTEAILAVRAHWSLVVVDLLFDENCAERCIQVLHRPGAAAGFYQQMKAKLARALKLIADHLAAHNEAEPASTAFDIKTAVPKSSREKFSSRLSGDSARVRQVLAHQITGMKAVLESYRSCCDTLIGVHKLSAQEGQCLLTADVSGVDIFELLRE